MVMSQLKHLLSGTIQNPYSSDIVAANHSSVALLNETRIKPGQNVNRRLSSSPKGWEPPHAGTPGTPGT